MPGIHSHASGRIERGARPVARTTASSSTTRACLLCCLVTLFTLGGIDTCKGTTHTRGSPDVTMSTTANAPDDSREQVPGPAERIAAFETDTGEIVIYNRQQNTAWIQSDTTMALDDQR